MMGRRRTIRASNVSLRVEEAVVDIVVRRESAKLTQLGQAVRCEHAVDDGDSVVGSQKRRGWFGVDVEHAVADRQKSECG